ncbi:lysine histidine transporter-like 8 [Salvia splendens]|uniref:lysine histidine transporter-like 8 n=1 Tax=Salvia splendens TaxID=180675 RepID=UPI001C27A28E|nr:lysine histidine transporter-like 8 [Salvia splendens]
MSEMVENGAAAPPLEGSEISPAAAAPNPMQSQYNSPSLSMKPLLMLEHPKAKTPSRTPNFITPLGSPIRRAMKTTRLDPQDAWLPITESRKGNAFYAAFHTLFAGIRIQALVIPVAFTILGWSWGIISLTVAFVWQLYTFWLLTNLHESTETGMRYSRYLQLFDAIFGEKTGKIFAVFPILYLSDGTCVALIVVGGSAIKLFYQIVYGGSGCPKDPLTMVEWYLVFTSATVLVSQLPNLNSIAGVSLIGSLTAVGYCTMMWCVSVTEGRLPSVSYDHVKPNTNTEWFFGVLNAFGIIAFAFRGHSVTLESMYIGTMPSSEKKPSSVPMWRGIQGAYIVIALCLFPIAIGRYWAYGNKVLEAGPRSAILAAIYAFHGRDTSQSVLGLISLFVIINAVSSFQIYGMPMFDDVESKITKRLKRPLPWWLRVISRFMFGYGCFFVAVAIPFLGSLAGLIGGIAVPVMFVYPSLMWIKVKKPQRHGFMWCLNWGLAIAGILLTMLLVAAGIHVIIDTGVEVSFFKPH